MIQDFQVTELNRAVVGIILYTDDGRVLLQQRDDKPALPYAGWWTFFGGSVEEGETPDEAVKRELMEELGISANLTFWHDYACPVRSKTGGMTTRNFMYTGRLSQPVESLTLHEGQAMRLFTPAEAVKLDLAYAQSGVLRAWFGVGMNGGCCTL